MSFYLGVDVGATKTHALIADESGRVRGFGRGGPATTRSSATTG
jgi:N-acetylglucosamine kinase-like BadF-type ATPase